MSTLSNQLMSLGFLVFRVPETATLIIQGGGIYTEKMDTEQGIKKFIKINYNSC
jgi:hypothetical protein